MASIESRRLRVRDDGTGHARDTDCEFSEFAHEDVIVLLGDPGMGKTTLFKILARANYKTVRQFLIDCSVQDQGPLFLDALDEFRAKGAGGLPDSLAKLLIQLGRPQFRLSCRAADWYGASDQEVIRLAGKSGRVIVLELSPLSDAEIIDAVQTVVAHPESFLNEAEDAGLGNLLRNPQSLMLIAAAWSSGRKPKNKFEAFEMGISELIRETNPEHVVRGTGQVDVLSLRQAAGAIASQVLLSNAAGVSRTDVADGNGFLNITSVPHDDLATVNATLKRRLFTSPAADRFEPAHRTIVEFLGAEDLAQRIRDGMPIDRIMALMCGVDGAPASSLRGLFAWLMCKIGPTAQMYVARDPYGVATYGDASVLPPSAQCAIWRALESLEDPWFLSNEDSEGSFRNLANESTLPIIRTILQTTDAQNHLKVAALEAVSNSTGASTLKSVIRPIVIAKSDHTRLRETALRAFARCVNSDWAELQKIDNDLASLMNDAAAPEVRIALLKVTLERAQVPQRILAILKHALSSEKTNIVGRFYGLLPLPVEGDLDVLLDGASQVLRHRHEDRFEFRYLFSSWFERRLKAQQPIAALQLSKWLRETQLDRDEQDDNVTGGLQFRFEQQPKLFEEVFDHLSTSLPNEEKSFWLFVVSDLWRLVPAVAWPVAPLDFLLNRAAEEQSSENAADLLRIFMSRIPIERGNVELTERAFALIENRPNIEKALGNWRQSEIPKWRISNLEHREQERQAQDKTRLENIGYLKPRIATIRNGEEEEALGWAAWVYLNIYPSSEKVAPRERLVSRTNEEIADALIQGFYRYSEQPRVPTQDSIMTAWATHTTAKTHTLLALSIFLRHSAEMDLQDSNLPQAIAAVVTCIYMGDRLPGFQAGLASWLNKVAREKPEITHSVLKVFWLQKRVANLPGFDELKADENNASFLAGLASEVLAAGIKEDHQTVDELLCTLLQSHRDTVVALGDAQLAQSDLSPEVRALWVTALFVAKPEVYRDSFVALSTQPSNVLWEAMALLRSVHGRPNVALTPQQRGDVVTFFGQHFPNTSSPSDGWSGDRNPWDATEFLVAQIRQLAGDISSEAGRVLSRLEKSQELLSYRNFIKHNAAQRARRERETSFAFAAAQQVKEALRNGPPANPIDLLSYVIDHLVVLTREIRGLPTERFRAYWNEQGHKLIEPKHEEVCSGLLADDLQRRIQAQGLIATVEHHMVAQKECDLVVQQGIDVLLPIEAKHHYHADLWIAWQTQLDRLYTRDARAAGLGIYLVFWSGETNKRRMPAIPTGFSRPSCAAELRSALESLIPGKDRNRLRVVVVDISDPMAKIGQQPASRRGKQRTKRTIGT